MKVQGLDALIKGLNRFARFLDSKATKNLLEKLGKEGVEYAKSQVLNIDTGATRDSINYHIDGNVLTIEAGGNAVWLEFGTGVAKNPSAYPVPVEGIVGHGEYGDGRGSNLGGWYFKTSDPRLAAIDRETGEYWMLPNGEFLAHTFGIEQNMFMWKTADVLTERATQLGLEIIDYGIRYDY